MFLVGLVLVLGLAMAAAPIGVEPMAQDTTATYRDSAFTIAGSVFKDGSTIYVNASDGKTSAPATNKRGGIAYTDLPTNNITFPVYDNGTGDDFDPNNKIYRGHFTMGTVATNDTEPVNHLQMVDGGSATIWIDLDMNGDWIPFSITADYTSPTITQCNVTPDANWTGIGKNFTVTLQGEANGFAWFSYNGTNHTMVDMTGGNYALNYTVQMSESHKANLTCWHNDTAGNEASTTTPEELWVDTLGPVITAVNPVEGEWTNNSLVNISFNIMDGASGVNATSTLVWANGILLNTTNVGGDYNSTTMIAYAEGNVTVVVNATDNVGNEATESWNFTVDTQAPWLVNMSAPLNNSKLTNGNVQFNVTGYDALSDQIYCGYDYGLLEDLIGWINNATLNTSYFNRADGVHVATPFCQDLANNIASGDPVTYTVDTTPPAITVALNNNYVNENQTVQITATVTDLTPGYNVSIWVNNTQLNTTYIGGDQFQADYTHWDYGGGEDFLFVNVTANDTWGHFAFDDSENFTVDNTAPGTVIGLGATGGTGQIALSWTAVVDANLAGYRVYRSITSGSGFALIATTGATSYTNTGLGYSETYYYRVSAIDQASNEGNQSNQASATTAADPGSAGGDNPPGDGGDGPPVNRIISDPPMDTVAEDPITLPVATPTPDGSETDDESGGWMKDIDDGDDISGLKPGRVKNESNPVTGLLFLNGEFLVGLAALLAVASVWIMWSSSKRWAKRKWYEE